MSKTPSIEERYPGLSLGRLDPESGELRYGPVDLRKIRRFDAFQGSRLEPYVDGDSKYFLAIRNTMDGWMRYQCVMDPELAGEGPRVGYENGPADFKIHIQPVSLEVCEAAFAIIDLCRELPEFRQALEQMKFALYESRDPAIPEIVLYPDSGSIENTETLLTYIAPLVTERFTPGPRSPRHNLPVSGPCYVAQGSGDAKDAEPSYREQYDAATNRAILPEHLAAVQAMLKRVRAL